MRVKVTSYLDVVSSWCFWAEPMWLELKRRYAGHVDFEWKIALMDATGFPKSVAQTEWFYRRSGVLMRSPLMLKPGWFKPDIQECLAQNLVAEAARKLGVEDDRVRLALARATVVDGTRTGDWDTAVRIGAEAAALDANVLSQTVHLPEVIARVRATTAEFHAMQVTQRPTFVIDSEIGDRAVFSGFARIEPLAATIEMMFDDLSFYDAYRAHYGEVPPA